MLLLLFVVALFSFITTTSSSRHRWTDQDEAKRIAQIKLEERRLYEQQLGEKLPSSSSVEGTIEPADYEIPRVLPSPQYHHYQQYQKKQIGSRNPPPLNLQNASSSSTSPDDQWCFHCATPWHAISADMQRVVQNLLDIRRAQYPTGQAVTRDCVEPRDKLDMLPRQICKGYSHCQTLILTDHAAGTAFTLRGCAERFGAVDPEVLDQQRDNTCRKLHDKVDIQECICAHRKYCYAGSDRPWTHQYTPMSQWVLHQGQARSQAPVSLQLRNASPTSWSSTSPMTMLIIVPFLLSFCTMTL